MDRGPGRCPDLVSSSNGYMVRQHASGASKLVEPIGIEPMT